MSGTLVAVPLQEKGWVSNVVFSPDGSVLAMNSGDSLNTYVRLWDIEDRKPAEDLMRHNGRLDNLTFALDGTLWAVERLDGMISVGSSTAPNDTWRAAEPDRNRKTYDYIQVWDVSHGVPVGDPMPHEASLRTIAFNPDAMLLATGANYSDSAHVQVWDVSSGKPIGDRLLVKGRIHSLRLSPDGTRLAASSSVGTDSNGILHISGYIYVWDVASRELIRETAQASRR